MALALRNGKSKFFYHLRSSLNSAAPTCTAAVHHVDITLKPKSTVQTSPRQRPPQQEKQEQTQPIFNLDDTRELFRPFSTFKLLKSYLTLSAISMDSMVNFGSFIMEKFIKRDNILKKVSVKAIEHTIYGHFCGGTSLEKAGLTVKMLSRRGLRAMLDYGIERATDNETCDKNMEEFIGTIRFTKTLQVNYVVVKMTAIFPHSLLKKLSDLLRWQYKEDDKSLKLPWRHETIPIFSDASPFYHTTERPNPLTADEDHDLRLARNRLNTIVEQSKEAKVTLVVDAEESPIQPAIDLFTYSAAVDFRDNSEDRPLIYNTIQTYLKDSKERLMIAKRAADEMGVHVGFKLVRGAYMSYEEKTAHELGADSPIHSGIHRTHACFEGCANFMLDEVANGRGSVILATHNVQSVKRATKRAMDLGINKDNPNLEFAQLYGMAEALSYGLKNEGFLVSKYLPFGPVEQIMPYLIRRAEENKGFLANSVLDRNLMRKELLRRISPC